MRLYSFGGKLRLLCCCSTESRGVGDENNVISRERNFWPKLLGVCNFCSLSHRIPDSHRNKQNEFYEWTCFITLEKLCLMHLCSIDFNVHINEIIILNDVLNGTSRVQVHHLSTTLLNDCTDTMYPTLRSSLVPPNAIAYMYEWSPCECMSRVEIEIISRLFTFRSLLYTRISGSNNNKQRLLHAAGNRMECVVIRLHIC